MLSAVKEKSVVSRRLLYHTPLAVSMQKLSIPAFPISRLPLVSRRVPGLMKAEPRLRTLVVVTRQVHTSLTSKEELFNRANEVEFVTNLLKTSQPQLTLITGPVNLGKLMLIRHVLDELSKEIVPPKIFPLNVQELPFLDIESFIESLSKDLCVV